MPLSLLELKSECEAKIKILDELITTAEAKPVGSKLREEYGNLIAVILRSLICTVSGTDGLLKQCGYDKHLLFPLYSPIEACNLLRSYLLISETISNTTATLSVRDDLENKEIVYTTYLTFESWLFESVIDFKDKDIQPLSRYEIIRLIADKRGAHFDPVLDGRLYKITHESILPISVDGKQSTDNLYTETIIGIAQELRFSFKYFRNSTHSFIKSEDFVFVQVYNNKPFDTYKFVRSKIKINAYNSNPHHSCIVKEFQGSIYKILFRERLFDVAIIDITTI